MDEIILTYEQLYFLGEILKADYIDYRYIKAMPDIQKQYHYMKNKSISTLLSAGILKEDFSGDLKVPSAYAALLTPVFFGKEEYCVEASYGPAYLCHVKDGSVTAVVDDGNRLRLTRGMSEALSDVEKALRILLAQRKESCHKKDGLCEKDVIISCKHAKIGVGGVEQQLVLVKDAVYLKEKNESLRPSGDEAAIKAVLDVLEGGF